MSLNEEKTFINFWEFLGLPMNAPLADIKVAYLNKFTEIEKALDNQETTYTTNDLITVNNAFATLSDPYKRFLHNCQIDGEEPPRDIADLFDYDLDETEERDSREDLSEDMNATFIELLKNKMNEYFAISQSSTIPRSSVLWNVEKVVFKDIALGLAENYIKLQEKLEKKQATQKKRCNRL